MSCETTSGGAAVTEGEGRPVMAGVLGARGGRLLFGAGCLFIAAVSVHDAVLVVLHQSVIEHFEQNPLGKWLIAAREGEVWLFVLVKLGGTAVVCAALVTLRRRYCRLAWMAMGGVAGFQLFLLLYLVLG